MDTTSTNSQRKRAPLPDDIATVYREETELHWRRIITAILALLAVLTVTGWILMNSISVQQAAEVIGTKATEKAEPAEAQTTAAEEIEPPVLQLEDAIPAIPATVEPRRPEAQQQAAPQSAVPKLLGEVGPLMAGIPAPPGIAESPTEAEPPEGPQGAAASEQAVTASEEAGTVSEVGTAEFLEPRDVADPAQVTRNPYYVNALQLTSALDDKNPTDLLAAEISLAGRQLIKVYAYSELTNLKGERIYHEWFRGDKRIARIPVGVYLEDMRASSSKYIDSTMAGDWHLEITRANGEQLGRMDFRVKVDS